MRLITLNPDSMIEGPSAAQITVAVQHAYAERIEALILLADDANNIFMQTPCGGALVEHCVGPHGPIYAHNDTSLEMATTLFLQYARGDPTWQVAVPWHVAIKRV